ncbi:tyrosine-type recombinase/integrase [Rhizobium sp. TH2]|uniref:tyrosine-type recombinase/integrase n=1 Tax=Rhizobium sp. TH2 TaxID=2775403 RepID=UPI0021588454|nr:tyrosine-type recombinase/integrase [Rhizobium sp. TH2]UVC11197.1 tyrosine-type recombinase/integrase [Rhizobium sp. TH2]
MKLVLRNKTWQIIRRVPKRYASVEPRTQVWISLHTDSQTIAQQKAPIAWAQMIEGWEAALAGATDDAERRFGAAKELAAVRGYSYLPADRVARLPKEELLARIESVTKLSGEAATIEARAVLGGARQPDMTISKALETYWTLAKQDTLGKSEDQVRRWEHPRRRAITNLIELLGDKDISDISPDDMLDFRQSWMDRIVAGEAQPDTANKDLQHIGNILKTVVKMKRLGLVLPLDGLTFKADKNRTRPTFSVEWIKTKLLASGALAELNKEARCIVLGMINTGYRPGEAAGLLPHHIRLDVDLPHISIEPEGRQLKNKVSERVIPLVGVSLEAFKECPNGFPRYQTSSASLSATVNKFLRQHGLLETEDHVLYSLRHTFEDRMLAAGIDERIRRDLFGHSLGRERYGEGATLAHKRDVLQAIAL